LGVKRLLEPLCPAPTFVSADSDEPAIPNISYM
jgi:hypothetical protein